MIHTLRCEFAGTNSNATGANGFAQELHQSAIALRCRCRCGKKPAEGEGMRHPLDDRQAIDPLVRIVLLHRLRRRARPVVVDVMRLQGTPGDGHDALDDGER